MILCLQYHEPACLASLVYPACIDILNKCIINKSLNIRLISIQMIDTQNFQLKQLDQNNRGLFIKHQVKPWSTVLQCNPICTSVLSQFRDRFCSCCLMEKQLSRCSQCKVLYYCSKQCQKEDWKLHKYQCGIFKKIVQQKNIQPNKITMDFAINLRLWNIRNKNQQVQKQIENMCNLIEFQRHQKLTQFQQTAVVLIQNLQIERNQENMKVLIRQQSVVSLNSFTIQDYLCTYESIGIGLYSPANFINHHCHPNTTQLFDGRKLKLVANRPIEKGEEISISYMPRADYWSQRRKVCREEYLFECFCEECQVNKMFDQQLMYIKCPSCQQCALINKKKQQSKAQKPQQKETTENSIIVAEYQCQKCKKQLQGKQINQIKEKANQLLKIISSQQSGYDKSKKSLIQLRKIISERDPRFEPCIHQIYLESLNKASQDPKIFSESYILLKQMIELMPKWYRLNTEDQIPYVYVWRLAELGKLAYNLQKYKKACECTEKAHEILKKIKFGYEFNELKELKARYEEMKVGLSFNKAELFRKN